METKQNKKTKWIMIGILLLFLCIIVILAGLCYKMYINRDQDNSSPVIMDRYGPSGDSMVVTADSRDTLSTIQEKVEKGRIMVKMTQNWVFKDGGSSSNAYLANSEHNSYALRFEILLEDTGEVIMQSPDVPVGSCIENFPLSVKLKPGKYNVVVAHQQVEDGEVFNTVRTSAVITVE